MKFDLHTHTIYSSKAKWPFESIIRPLDLVKIAITCGLDGIAVTDHDTLDGAFKCMDIVKEKKLNLRIIPGIEIGSKEGHILGLGIEEWSRKKKLSAEEAIDTINGMGGIAIAAHPFVPSASRKGAGDFIGKLDFDGIEVLNYRTGEKYNKRAFDVAKKLNLGMTAGSDAHKLSDVGKVFTSADSDDVIDNILKNRTISFGKEMGRFQRYTYQLIKFVEFSKIAST